MASADQAQPRPLSTGGLTFQALREPRFRLIWAASWCYYIARMGELSTLLWLVLELTDSPSKVALVGVFRTAPMFLLGLVIGGLADRLPKLRLIATAQLLNTAAAGTVLLLLVTDSMQYWYAYVAVFFTGVAWTTDFSCRRLLFSELFAERRLVNAISLDTAVQTGSNMTGPLMAGVLISLSGFVGAYVGIMLFYFIGFLLILFLRMPSLPAATGPAPSPLSQVQALRSLKNDPVIWATLMITVTLNFFGFPYMQMVPVIARDVLGANAALYGVMASAIGIGAITGSLFIATGRFHRQGTTYSLGATLMLVAVFSFSFSQLYPLSVALLFVAGFGMSGFAVMQPILVMQAAPPGLRGRALGAVALGIGVSPLGIILVGQLAEILGPQTALSILTGIGILVVTALRWRYAVLRDKKASLPHGA